MFILVLDIKDLLLQIDKMVQFQRLNSFFRQTLTRVESGDTNMCNITFKEMFMDNVQIGNDYRVTFTYRFQLQESVEWASKKTFDRRELVKTKVNKETLNMAVTNAEDTGKVSELMLEMEQHLGEKT